MMCLENGLPNYGNRIGREGKKGKKRKRIFLQKRKGKIFFLGGYPVILVCV